MGVPDTSQPPRRKSESRIGERSGRLVIVGVEDTRDKRGVAVKKFRVRCDCGTEKLVARQNFFRTVSCGCMPRGPKAARRQIIGRRYGRLVVLRTEPHPTLKTNRIATCMCDCGRETRALVGNLCMGGTKSCGCLLEEARHRTDPNAATKHPLWDCWYGMNLRCTDPNNTSWGNYGGRGISVCERWRNDFWAFLADMGEKPTPEHSIDRIDVDGNYEPSNCRWATVAEQNRNRRNNVNLTFNGKTQCTQDWASEIGVSRELIRQRLAKGLPIEQVLQPRRHAVTDAMRAHMSEAARRRYAANSKP